MDAFRFTPITNETDFDNLVKSLHDPDADRFRYFAAAMMDSVCKPGNPAPQTLTLMQIMDMHKPRTPDELRVCIDAAKVLTP